MKKKKQFIVFIIAVVLLVLGDFGYNVYSKKLTDVEKSIDAYKQKYLDAELKNKELQETIENAINLNDDLNDRISELYNSMNKMSDEQLYFIISDRLGRKLIQAIISNDTNKLKELTSSDIKVFNSYFEKTVNGNISKVPFEPIHVVGLDNSDVVISLWRYYFDEESQSFVIMYNIINEQDYTSADCRMYFKIIEEKSEHYGAIEITTELFDIEIGANLLGSE